MLFYLYPIKSYKSLFTEQISRADLLYGNRVPSLYLPSKCLDGSNSQTNMTQAQVNGSKALKDMFNIAKN